ncbi:flagellin [Thermococcus sp. 18S1]|uniref:flagellin n=1 Tax=Thermococcus sp. 18S1 TaxID=1638210 RepID=UPI00143CB663|nr:flagellin [Thermococcus sp. 18S1]NJE29463.1 flagellin [Thermococcus sp. 18S1]
MKFGRKKRGAVGIGTLIVFIAMVLVAAVAAAVLINTSGYLQQRAEATGKQTTQQVSTGLGIDQVVGHVSGNSMDKMAIYISLRPGSEPVDLTQAVLTLDDGRKVVTLRYNSTFFVGSAPADLFDDNVNSTNKVTAWKVYKLQTMGNNTTVTISTLSDDFGIIVIQDADGSLTSSHPTINDGDIVVLTVNTNSIFDSVDPRTKITINIRPEVGAPAFATVVTPSSYSQRTILNLYP